MTQEQKLYFKILQQLLKAIHVSVLPVELQALLVTIATCCLWLPEEGTLDIELWEQAGKELKIKFSQGEITDSHILTTWSVVQMTLFPLYIVNTNDSS